jgi:hypothetical protein
MRDGRAGVEKDRAIGGRARFRSRAIDEHRVREVQRGHVHPATAQQLLGRLVEVPGIETPSEATKLTASQGAAGSSGIVRPKDLRFTQEVPLSVRHRLPFVQVLLVKSLIQTITGV